MPSYKNNVAKFVHLTMKLKKWRSLSFLVYAIFKLKTTGEGVGPPPASHNRDRVKKPPKFEILYEKPFLVIKRLSAKLRQTIFAL